MVNKYKIFTIFLLKIKNFHEILLVLKQAHLDSHPQVSVFYFYLTFSKQQESNDTWACIM